jgi:hypothetical protein
MAPCNDHSVISAASGLRLQAHRAHGNDAIAVFPTRLSIRVGELHWHEWLGGGVTVLEVLKDEVTDAPNAVVGDKCGPIHQLRIKLIRSATIGLLANAMAKHNFGRWFAIWPPVKSC